MRGPGWPGSAGSRLIPLGGGAGGDHDAVSVCQRADDGQEKPREKARLRGAYEEGLCPDSMIPPLLKYNPG